MSVCATVPVKPVSHESSESELYSVVDGQCARPAAHPGRVTARQHTQRPRSFRPTLNPSQVSHVATVRGHEAGGPGAEGGVCGLQSSFTINETLKWLSSLPILMHESFWW